MSITLNQSKPTTSIIDTSKPNQGETWASILTTWASETHTWAAVSSLVTNPSKPTTSFTNQTRPS